MMKNKLLVGVGECMVELSGDGNPLFSKAFAGDVLNTLWYATAASGGAMDTAFCSGVGDDPLSDQMLSFIASAGIECSSVQRIAGKRPGLYMIHLDGAERSFSYWRDSSAAKLMARDRLQLEDAMSNASLIYLSGITLAILSKDDRESLMSVIDDAKAKGAIVAFDPNIRPILWEDEKTMRSAISETARRSDIVLPSFDDEASAFGDATPSETAKRYSTEDDQLIIVKDGASEVLAYQHSMLDVYHTDVVERAVDTTGAGDSFNGAFLANYLLHEDVGNAVRAGQKCAGQVICHPGALVSHDLLDLS